MPGRHGIAAEWVKVAPASGGIAATILNECGRLRAELLVMGGVTHDILAATPIPVFLEH